MPHLDAIGQVLKRHDAAADFLVRGRGLAGGKQMFKDLHHPLAERSIEVVEDEVGVRLRDSTARGRGKVMAEEDVMEGKGGRGSVREVRDCERCGGTAVFVQQKQVRESGGIGTLDQGREN